MVRAEWQLPWPAKTTNHMYAVSRGRVRLDCAARDWKMLAANIVKRQGCKLPKGRLAITFYQHPPKGWRGDTDGTIKLAQDAVFLGLGLNDYWVAEVHAYRGIPSGEGHIDVILEPCRWRSIDEVRP